jgi:hypothetical protein
MSSEHSEGSKRPNSSRVPEMRPPVGCDIAPIPCYNPKQCFDCKFFHRHSWKYSWVCISCAKEEDRIAPYYSKGECSRCGEECLMLRAVTRSYIRD